MKRTLITGANRGIGLEFVRQTLERGDRVFGTCRDPQNAGELIVLEERYPDRLTIVPLDVAEQDTVEAASRIVGQHTDALDWLINNAGVYPQGERPGRLTREGFRRTFEVNATGPAMVTQAFLDLLRKGRDPLVAMITSGMGSIGGKSYGGYYSYSASKAALNMLARLFSFDLRGMGITVVTIDPGWAQTDMGGSGAPLPVDQSIRGMLNVFDGLSLAYTGRFFEWDGSEIEW